MMKNFKNLLFENIGIKQTIFKNTFWLAFAEGISKMFTSIVVIYAARILGATEFGVFSFALAFVGLFIVFSNFGIFGITTRELARDKKNEEFFPAIVTLKLVLSILTLALIVFVSFFAANNFAMRRIIWILAGYELANSFFLIIYAFLEARQQMQYEAVGKIVQAILISGFGFFILFYAPSILNLSLAYFISSSIALGILLLFFSFRFQRIRLCIDLRIWRDLLRMSWSLGLASAIGMILVRIDSVMMGYWGQLTETGWYNAAYRIVGAAMVLSTLILSSFFPVLSSIFRKSQEQAQRIYNLYREVTIVITVPLIIGGIVLAPQIILFLYGESYMPAVLAFQILIAIAGVNFLYNPYSMMFVVSGRQKAILLINSIGAGINIALNVVLIPRYSLYGAAIATLITYVVLLLITFELSRRFIPFNLFYRGLFKTLIVAIISSMLMLGVITVPFISSLHVLLVVAFGIAIYLAALFFFIRVGFLEFNLKNWIV